LIKTHWIKPTF